jgi:hypothetical protein
VSPPSGGMQEVVALLTAALSNPTKAESWPKRIMISANHLAPSNWLKRATSLTVNPLPVLGRFARHGLLGPTLRISGILGHVVF